MRRDDYFDAIEVDAPGGTHVLGAPESPYSGVFPEDVVADADEWGSKQLSFLLRRPALVFHADLAAGTLVRYYHGGDGTPGSAELRWSGRVESTPDASDVEDGPQIRVECEGAQAELDDDAFVAAWLLVGQERWQDIKTASEVDRNTTDPLHTWMKHGPSSAGQVAKWSKSTTMLAIPEGSKLYGYQKTGVLLDARRWPSMQQLYVAWHRIAATLAPNTAGLDLVVCGSPSPHFVGSTRVEYWRASLASLAFQGEHRIDPTGDVRPMPYVGVFLELVPPAVTVSGVLDRAGAMTNIDNGAQVIGVGFDVGGGGARTDDVFVVVLGYQGNDAGNPVPTPPPGQGWTLIGQDANPWQDSGGGSHQPYYGGRMAVFAKRAAAGFTGDGDVWSWVGGDGAGLTSYQLSVYRNVVPSVAGISVSFGHGVDTVAVAHTAQREGSVYLQAAVNTTLNGPFSSSVAVGAAWADRGGASGLGADIVQLTVKTWDDTAVGSHHTGDAITLAATFAPYTSTVGSGVAAIIEVPRQVDPSDVDLDAAVTFVTEARVLLTALKLAPDAAMLGSDGTSSVPPDRLVVDALRHAPRLDQDASLIGSPGGSLEEYAIDTPLTPREVIDAARALNGWQARVTLDRKLEFRAYPADPVVELPSDRGWALEDAAGDALADTWNGSWVVGSDPGGRPVLSKMGTAGALPPVELTVAMSDVEGVGWEFDGDADGRALLGSADYVSDNAVSGQAIRLQTTAPYGSDGEGTVVWTQRLGGAFQVGSEYLLKLALRAADTLWTDSQHLLVRLVLYGRNMRLLSREVTVQLDVASTYRTVVVPFVAVDPRMDLYVVAGARGVTGAARDVLWLDHLQLTRVATTPLDAAGVRRTKVLQATNVVTPLLADQLNDALLVDTARPQFRGSIRVQGWTVRLVGAGASVHASSLLDRCGERMRLMLLPDPQTGVSPRVARLVAVSYDAAEQAATLTFDNAPHAQERVAARVDAAG